MFVLRMADSSFYRAQCVATDLVLYEHEGVS